MCESSDEQHTRSQPMSTRAQLSATSKHTHVSQSIEMSKTTIECSVKTNRQAETIASSRVSGNSRLAEQIPNHRGEAENGIRGIEAIERTQQKKKKSMIVNVWGNGSDDWSEGQVVVYTKPGSEVTL